LSEAESTLIHLGAVNMLAVEAELEEQDAEWAEWLRLCATQRDAGEASCEDGRFQAGVVVDLSRIPKDKLVARDRELYDRAVDQFPGITKRDVYIGIEDRPVSADGVLQLGPAPEVRVGNLRYPLDTAARKIGMSPAELRRELDLELHRLGFVDPTHPG
jgi:hypothetical protein